MKGVTNLTGSFGTRAYHHHIRENRNEKKQNDRNKTQTDKVKMYNVGKKIMNDPKMAQTNNDTMDSQYSPIQTINVKHTKGGPQLR